MSSPKRNSKKPVLLLSPNAFKLPANASRERYLRSLKNGTEIYDLLKAKGCDVRLLGATSSSCSRLRSKYVDDFEKRRPRSVLRIEGNRPIDECMISWPRDGFQIYGDLVFSSIGFEKTTIEVLSKLGRSPIKIETSELGIGGMVVGAGKLLVFSESIKKADASRRKGIGMLRQHGYAIRFMPPSVEYRLAIDRTKGPSEHIDLSFNLAATKEGNMLACAYSEYYKYFRGQVDKLVKEIDAQLHVIPEDEGMIAANFIGLPDGKVVLPEGCPSTQAFFERHLSSSNVFTIKVDALVSNWQEGGFRCMSNLVQ